MSGTTLTNKAPKVQPPAATVAPFEAAIKAFASNYTQADGPYQGEAQPVQQKTVQLGDTSDYVELLKAAEKFRASNLYWLTPITATADGHAYCKFVLAYFPSED